MVDAKKLMKANAVLQSEIMKLLFLFLLLTLVVVDAGFLGECSSIQDDCEGSWNGESPVPPCVACISVIEQYWDDSYNCNPDAATILLGLCNTTETSTDNVTQEYIECAIEQASTKCEKDKTKRGAILCFTLIWGGMVLFMILICLRRSHLFRFSSATMIDNGPSSEKASSSQKEPSDAEKGSANNSNADVDDNAEKKSSE